MEIQRYIAYKRDNVDVGYSDYGVEIGKEVAIGYKVYIEDRGI